MDAVIASIGHEPTWFPDCCCAVSHRLVSTLLDRLPHADSSLVLSIGAGTGMLEEILRRKSGLALNIVGVEVDSCPNKYLPPERMFRVSSTTELHSEGLIAASFLFVYPRQASLVKAYLEAGVRGALQLVVVIINRTDWFEHYVAVLEDAFSTVEVIHNASCGLPAFEVLAVASHPKDPPAHAIEALRP